MSRARAYYVYIHVSRPNGTLYTGVTNNLERRLWEHRQDSIEGFTKRYGVHRLVHFEETDDVASAIRREKVIKGWSRARKIALIESENPLWKDLAEGWFDAVPDRTLRMDSSPRQTRGSE